MHINILLSIYNNVENSVDIIFGDRQKLWLATSWINQLRFCTFCLAVNYLENNRHYFGTHTYALTQLYTRKQLAQMDI